MQDSSFRKFPFGFPSSFSRGNSGRGAPSDYPESRTGWIAGPEVSASHAEVDFENAPQGVWSARGQDDPSSGMPVDDLARIFNTALVATKTQEGRDFPAELYKLMESPAFRAILASVRQHARAQGLTEKHAAEQIIRCFRKMDELWSSYVFQEGVDRLGSGS